MEFEVFDDAGAGWEKAWADLRGHSLREVPYPETPGGVQLARLAAIDVFLDERRRVRDRQLVALKA